MSFKIEAREWSGPGVVDGDAPVGCEEDAYLPGFAEQSFETREDAEAWIASNHRGPDAEGVSLRFEVVETECGNAPCTSSETCGTASADPAPATETETEAASAEEATPAEGDPTE